MSRMDFKADRNQLIFDKKKRSRIRFCPCGKSNRDGKFIPYVGFDDKGYCHSCSRTFLPTSNFLPTQLENSTKANQFKQKPKISYIEYKFLEATSNKFEFNNFVLYLTKLFGREITNDLIQTYRIGTSKHWPGATIFWQIDNQFKIRSGKVMLYNPTTGKRIKEPFSHITWVHKLLQLPDFQFEQCLFGEHLLAVNTKPIAIVESEKTALIASVYLPNFLWLAAGGKAGLTRRKCEILNKQKQKIFLFPDCSIQNNETKSTYENWAKAASSHLNNYKISDLLEALATESDKINGNDLADFLIRYPLSNFRKHITN